MHRFIENCSLKFRKCYVKVTSALGYIIVVSTFIIQLIFLQQYFPIPVRAVQYHAILHGTGIIARVLLHGPWGYAVS